MRRDINFNKKEGTNLLSVSQEIPYFAYENQEKK